MEVRCEFTAWRTTLELWRTIVGSDSEEEDFEGFTELDLVKIERESDLDLDNSNLFDSSVEESGGEEDLGSSVDPPPAGHYRTEADTTLVCERHSFQVISWCRARSARRCISP